MCFMMIGIEIFFNEENNLATNVKSCYYLFLLICADLVFVFCSTIESCDCHPISTRYFIINFLY